jgi:predicted ArsR family transcriptional regulator
MELDRDAHIAGVSALRGPVRRRLYEFVCAQPEPVTRDAAAEAVGVKRSLAAFHLDKLAAAGLLEVSFRRPPGRSGPGAGRPTKRYRRSAREVQVSLPPRRYDLAADLLATAMSHAQATGQRPSDALREVAHGYGARLSTAARTRISGHRSASATQRAVHAVLADHGFQPRAIDGLVVLDNCPFHQLARAHSELVCGMNLAVMQGLLETLPSLRLEPRLDPGPGRCCVLFQPPSRPNGR